MRIDLLLPAQIDAGWERIGALLAPAIARDDMRQAIDVYRDLMAGDMALFDIDVAPARGVVVIEFATDERGVKRCWLIYIGGRITALPRAWRAIVVSLAAYFEEIARSHGCAEMRVEGRDWSGVLAPAGYGATGERPGRNELRKEL